MPTITYPLALPTVRKGTSLVITPNSVVALSQSPYTGASQTQEHPGQWWNLEYTMPPMKRDDAASFQAFLLKLNGMAGTFLAGDPLAKVGRGALTGVPLVKGAGQVAGQRTLVIDGAPNNIVNWIREGDYVQLGSGATARLHMQLFDANSDGTGTVSLTLWPALRSSPADNDPLVITNCMGVFRRINNAVPWTEDEGVFYNMSFAAMEVI